MKTVYFVLFHLSSSPIPDHRPGILFSEGLRHSPTRPLVCPPSLRRCARVSSFKSSLGRAATGQHTATKHRAFWAQVHVHTPTTLVTLVSPAWNCTQLPARPVPRHCLPSSPAPLSRPSLRKSHLAPLSSLRSSLLHRGPAPTFLLLHALFQALTYPGNHSFKIHRAHRYECVCGVLTFSDPFSRRWEP